RTQGVTAAENEAKHFTRKCFGEIATGAVKSRAHLIIETADPGTGIEPIVSSFRAQGYKSHLIALSVPDFVSRQALAIREKVEKERLGYARI
ncbi:zeta toxin family protein, partial [Acinetobacter baumannii]